MRWTASDEARHDDSAGGTEGWTFGFTDVVATGEVRLVFDAASARAAFVAQFVILRAGRVVVADEHVALPRPQTGLEIRADGLWAAMTCETAFEHWSLGLEAFGLRVGDDVEASGAGAMETAGWDELVGERIPVGFDLEWELRSPPEALGDGNGYRQIGAMFGELLVARDRVVIDALPAWRDHWW
jgi:hypothetical protein